MHFVAPRFPPASYPRVRALGGRAQLCSVPAGERALRHQPHTWQMGSEIAGGRLKGRLAFVGLPGGVSDWYVIGDREMCVRSFFVLTVCLD